MIKSIIALFSIVLTSITFSQTAKGYVFNDENGNGIMDVGEKGIAEVCVSNGADVVQTDTEGKWELSVTDDTGLFVIKPAGYSVPMNENMIPQYYYLHKPKGSTELEKGGIEPTGELPESVNFPLVKSNEPNKFSALFFGDTQASHPIEVNYINHDVVEELIGTDAKFGVGLGDIVGHDLDLFKGISEGIAQIGIPWHYVFGNHDNDRDAKVNKDRDDTFERYFGPSTYAFEYGQVVFIGINDIYFDSNGKYRPHFLESQIQFLKNYLKFVPEDKLVVLMMHIPIFRPDNKEEVFNILKDRPHTFSISGHVHDQLNVFVDSTNGWYGDKPHHHLINATVCGSWWSGQIDEVGIPHATMNDGAPNGYSIVTFDGNQYSVKFKAARKPDHYQMNIYVPNEVSKSGLDTTKVLVNVFAGSEKSVVEMKVGKDGEWQQMNKVNVVDPENVRMHALTPIFEQEYDGVKIEEVLGWPMDRPHASTHMWEGMLPDDPDVGAYTVKVRTTDMFGQKWEANRIFYIIE